MLFVLSCVLEIVSFISSYGDMWPASRLVFKCNGKKPDRGSGITQLDPHGPGLGSHPRTTLSMLGAHVPVIQAG